MHQSSSATTTALAAIEINGVSKAYDARLVLDDIDLTVPFGSAPCLCGVNGAGKSTLMRIMAGVLQPSTGAVSVGGFDIAAEPEKARCLFGVIGHDSMLYDDLTVEENLLFYARLYGVEQPGARVTELLDDVGLSRFRHDKTRILSRGMLQRLAIGRALVHQPRILLADEPFTGLDLNAVKHLVDVLGDFRRRGGTFVMTTHDTGLGLSCCDRVVVLDDKRIIYDAGVDTLDRESFSRDYLTYARSRT